MIFSFFKSVSDTGTTTHDEYSNMLDIDLAIWGVIAMVLMLVEMTIYLAYNKDVIFSLMTLTDFIGMYLKNKEGFVLEHETELFYFPDFV